MAAPVAPAAAGPPTWLDRARVDGSGLVCPVAVLAERPPGRASGFAHQVPRVLSARWDAVLSPLEELCPPAGDALAGPGHCLSESRAAGGVHPGGPGGGPLSRPMGCPYRSAAGGE